MKNRWEILIDLIKKHNFKNIIEIGVSKGENANYVVNNCKLNNYYLIDPDPNGVFEYRWFSGHPEAKFIRLWSQEAEKLFNPETIDLVFIDGEHSYDAVRRDISLYKSKIRQGGIICGHDYLVGMEQNKYEVNRAVEECFEKFNLEQDILEEGKVNIWWTYK